jgi:phage shock protein PspC (stress-responsive transcriptional regulator)
MSEYGTTAPPPDAGPSQPRAASTRPPLRRSRGDRKLAGVCGGLGDYLGIDPIILRIAVVVLAIFGGTGLVLYVAGWLLIPEEGDEMSELQRLFDGRSGGRGRGLSTAAAIVVAIGVLWLVVMIAESIGAHWWFGPGPDLWPLVVIGLIVLAVWYSRRSPNANPTGAPPSGPYRPQSADASDPSAQEGSPMNPGAQWSSTGLAGTAEYPSSGFSTQAFAAQAPTTEGYSPEPYVTRPYETASGAGPWASTATLPPPAGPQPPPLAFIPPPPKPKRQRSVLGPLTLSAALVAAGVMILLNSSGAWHLRILPFTGVLLAIVGLGLLIGTFVGRSRGLIAAGILLSLVAMVAAAAPGIDSRQAGQVTFAPTTSQQIPAGGYQWAAGDVRLDLSGFGSTGQTVTIHAQLGAGRLRIWLPTHDTVVLNADVNVGDIEVSGIHRSSGIGATYHGVISPPGVATGTVLLDVNVGAGHVEVIDAQA